MSEMERYRVSPEDNKSFEQQFNNPEVKEVYGGEIEIYDITPEELKDEVPIIVAPGWVANAELFKDNMRVLAQRERRSLAVGNYHGVDTDRPAPEEMANTEWRKVAALIGTMEAKNIDKADVIAHSEGAIYTLLAAKMYPEKFRRIVLVSPAGFIENDSISKLAARFSVEAGREFLRGVNDGEVRNKSLAVRIHAGRAMKEDPVAMVQQVFAMSGRDMAETLRELQAKDVDVAILHSFKDKAFPVARVKKATHGKVKQFKTRPGSHNEILLNAGMFTRAAERMLTSMEKE